MPSIRPFRREGRLSLASFDRADNGFDTIRLIAATAVIFSHAFVLTGTPEPLEALTDGQATIGALAVSAFFVISGYLIPASLDRGSLWRYIENRARRIMPALAAAVLVCALIIGPLVTSLDFGSYLAAGGTWTFLGNMLFLPVGYELPGVFFDHPVQAANGSLWSLKFELACYFFVPLAMVYARFRLCVVAAAWLASFIIARSIPDGVGGALFYINAITELFRFFGAGMLAYLLAPRIPINTRAAWISLLVTAVATLTPLFMEIAAVFGSYCLVAFAYLSPRVFRRITAKGDISYGVYVYAFPIQQLLVPVTIVASIGGMTLGWVTNLVLSLPLVLVSGALSWILVERPWLRTSPRQVKTPRA